MQIHEIPRNYKGESRILYIFSTKALIWTGAVGAVGLLFYFIFNLFFTNYIMMYLSFSVVQNSFG